MHFLVWWISYLPCLLTMAELLPIYFSVIAFFCALGAMALAIFHIYRHLLNYTEPTYQRHIVRIIFMVPVYALMSFLSLIFPESSIYFNSICEVYEAWVIYNFLSLCLAWVGGPGAVVPSLSGRVMKPSWCQNLMLCLLMLADMSKSPHVNGRNCHLECRRKVHMPHLTFFKELLIVLALEWRVTSPVCI